MYLKFCALIIVNIVLVAAFSSENVEGGSLRFRRQSSEIKCGIMVEQQALKRSVGSTKVSKIPWLAAIYFKTDDDKWEQRCHGTLITPHIVVTAAHCVTRDGNVKIQPEEIQVGFGKYYRDFYKSESSSVISRVKEVVVPPQYFGHQEFHFMDIALLDLADSVQVTDFIMPACVDWNHSLNPTSEGAVGHFAGWWKRDHVVSETVLRAQLKLISNEKCLKITSGLLQSSDKFCSENVDAEENIIGASGCGVTFVKNGVHFLLGPLTSKISRGTDFLISTNITYGDVTSWLSAEKHRLEQSHIQ